MAAVTSPTSASPRQLLLEWDEETVHSYLVHIGLPQYEELVFGEFHLLICPPFTLCVLEPVFRGG